MATFTVTTAADRIDPDDGVLSLRETVSQANAAAGADTILFGAGLEGRTLTLTQGQLTLSFGTTIDGDRNDDGSRVVLSGGNASRVLDTVADAGVTLRDLGIADGRVSDANRAGIRVGDGGSLTMENCSVTGCRAGEESVSFGSGGGVFLGERARLDMSGSTVRDNAAYSAGGIFSAERSHLYLRNSTIGGNHSSSGGGIYAAGYGFISTSTFWGNGLYTYNNDEGRDGGLHAAGRVEVSASLFAANGAPRGGGIYSSGSVTVIASTIADNTSRGDEFPGGNAGIGGYDITLRHATVTGNHSYGSSATTS